MRLAGVEAQAGSEIGPEITAAVVRRAVSVSAGAVPAIVYVSATTADPLLAREIANTYTVAFADARNHSAHEYYASQLAVVSSQLSSLSHAQRVGVTGIALEQRQQTLHALADNPSSSVTISQHAVTPTRASSPAQLRDTVLACLIGLLLGTGFALLRARLDPDLNGPAVDLGRESLSTHGSWGPVRLVGPVVAAGLAVGAGAGFDPAVLVLAALVPMVGLALFAVARNASPLIAIGLILLMGGIAVPDAVGAGALVCLALFIGYRIVVEGGRRALVGAACLAVVGLWLLLGLNPDIGHLHEALLGTRKTAAVFLGFGVGALWPRSRAEVAEPTIVALLVILGLVCLGVHLLDSTYEYGLSRQSGYASQEFAGKLRMEGILPGPVHVALLGTFLMVRAWHGLLLKRYRLAAGLGTLGLILTLEADVRTAFVTLAGSIVLTLLVKRPAWLGRRQMLAGTTVIAVIAAAAVGAGVLGHNAALNSLPALGNNARATSRLNSWSKAISDFEGSPVYGLGPGSAGSTLGAASYGIHTHVTSDNQYLGILVEGGILGALAVLLCLTLMARGSEGILSIENASCAATFVLIGFAFTGNVFETIPISIMLAILIGIRVRERPGANPDGAPAITIARLRSMMTRAEPQPDGG